ncbi:MAG: GNAT family N-acetyltransferase [Aeromonas sp.]|uniref:GNAT family N-acetyltransferase n=1 Tax=Aeromonas sp. TaxID=647 RepID=UPI003F3FED90
MELLIEGGLWRPHWLAALQAWRGQGHSWQLLQSKRAGRDPQIPAPWAACPPDGILSASALLAAWLDGDEAPVMAVDPSRQILICTSSALLILAKESGLLTLGPVGADLTLGPDDDLAVVLERLLARRLSIPELREPGPGALVLRPLRAEDEAEIARYCADGALARYTLNIPHPYPSEAARDWLAMSGRKAALGLGRTWALSLPTGSEPAPLLGVISLHWSGELAWWVGVPWQNRGLATRAATLVKRFAFEQWQLPALTARHMPDNLASGRVMAKIGMHCCGVRAGTDGQGTLSHWRLDRAPILSAPLRASLIPWLEDERVVVAILHGPWEREGSGNTPELALFMDDEMDGEGQDGTPGRATAGLVVRSHPVSWLEGEGPLSWTHGDGVLLKERGELGLNYLLVLRDPRRGDR